jgi:hypothetical protein
VAPRRRASPDTTPRPGRTSSGPRSNSEEVRHHRPQPRSRRAERLQARLSPPRPHPRAGVLARRRWKAATVRAARRHSMRHRPAATSPGRRVDLPPKSPRDVSSHDSFLAPPHPETLTPLVSATCSSAAASFPVELSLMPPTARFAGLIEAERRDRSSVAPLWVRDYATRRRTAETTTTGP